MGVASSLASLYRVYVVQLRQEADAQAELERARGGADRQIGRAHV